MITHEEQYNAFPYPFRDLKDEKTRVVTTELDNLERIKKRTGLDLSGNQEVLVIGCGTGDAPVYLSKQNPKLKILAIDIAAHSLEIAQKRAKVHGFTNIEFKQRSLFDQTGEFDYVNASGVLHHIRATQQAFKRLRSLTKGVAGVMVYGKYGRTGVTQLRDAVRIATKGKTLKEKVETTRAILKTLPQSNWFWRGRDLIAMKNETEIVDLFVNPFEVVFDIPLLKKMLDTSGLEFIHWASEKTEERLSPEWIRDEKLSSGVKDLGNWQSMAVCEILLGTLKMHKFYVRRS